MKKNLKHLMEKQLMPALDHIDNHACDQATVDFSVEKQHTVLNKIRKVTHKKFFLKSYLSVGSPNKNSISLMFKF